MADPSPAYGPCPYCRSINLATRRECYRCGKPLPTEFWIICEQNARGGINGYRPRFWKIRQFPRYDIHMPLELGGSSISDQIVTLRNISLGGVQFVASYGCAPTSHVWLYVPLHERHTHLLQGVIRYSCVRQLGTGAVYMCGIQFQESYARVSDIMTHLLAQAGEKRGPDPAEARTPQPAAQT
jgi:hypothetical protein